MNKNDNENFGVSDKDVLFEDFTPDDNTLAEYMTSVRENLLSTDAGITLPVSLSSNALLEKYRDEISAASEDHSSEPDNKIDFMSFFKGRNARYIAAAAAFAFVVGGVYFSRIAKNSAAPPAQMPEIARAEMFSAGDPNPTTGGGGALFKEPEYGTRGENDSPEFASPFMISDAALSSGIVYKNTSAVARYKECDYVLGSDENGKPNIRILGRDGTDTVSALLLQDYTTEILVQNDLLIALGESYDSRNLFSLDYVGGKTDFEDVRNRKGSKITRRILPYTEYAETLGVKTTVVFYELSDPKNPTPVGIFSQDGMFLQARADEQRLLILSRKYPDYVDTDAQLTAFRSPNYYNTADGYAVEMNFDEIYNAPGAGANSDFAVFSEIALDGSFASSTGALYGDNYSLTLGYDAVYSAYPAGDLGEKTEIVRMSPLRAVSLGTLDGKIINPTDIVSRANDLVVLAIRERDGKQENILYNTDNGLNIKSYLTGFAQGEHLYGAYSEGEENLWFNSGSGKLYAAHIPKIATASFKAAEVWNIPEYAGNIAVLSDRLAVSVAESFDGELSPGTRLTLLDTTELDSPKTVASLELPDVYAVPFSVVYDFDGTNGYLALGLSRRDKTDSVNADRSEIAVFGITSDKILPAGRVLYANNIYVQNRGISGDRMIVEIAGKLSSYDLTSYFESELN